MTPPRTPGSFREADHPRDRHGRFAPKTLNACDATHAAVADAAAAEGTSGTSEIMVGLINDPTAHRIAQRLAADGHDVVIVGGPVRDVLLGRDPKDIDLATSALPDQTRAALDPLGSVYDVGARFGTIAVNVPGAGDYEVTTYRGDEQYEPGSRHPQVTLGVRLEEDLARRDFTVNAMAWRPATGELIDPFGGRADLEAGVLRTPLDPDVTFQDDPLRIARAVRFAAVNGWTIDPDTLAGARRNADRLPEVARERRTEELRRVLAHPDPSTLTRAIDIAEQIGCTRHLFGQADTASVRHLDLTVVPPEHRLAAVVHVARDRKAAAADLRAVKFTNDEVRAAVDTATAAAAMRAARTLPEARAVVRAHSDDALRGARALLAAQREQPSTTMSLAFADRDRVRGPLPVTGDDLLAGGLRGRQIGDALRQVEAAYLANPDLTRSEALRLTGVAPA